MKTCTFCGESKKFEEYRQYKNGSYRKICKSCSYQMALATKSSLMSRLRIKYGIEHNQYMYLVDKQGGVCALCKERPIEVVDHCHINGHVRGLLCQPCNVGLGMFKDSKDKLQDAINYLEQGPVEVPDPIRDVRKRHHICGQYNNCPGREILEQWYLEEWLSVEEIGKRLKVKPAAIYTSIEAHGIAKRGNIHKCGKGNKCPGELEMKALAARIDARELTTSDVAKQMGISSPTVNHYFKSHAIVRPKSKY